MQSLVLQYVIIRSYQRHELSQLLFLFKLIRDVSRHSFYAVLFSFFSASIITNMITVSKHVVKMFAVFDPSPNSDLVKGANLVHKASSSTGLATARKRSCSLFCLQFCNSCSICFHICFMKRLRNSLQCCDTLRNAAPRSTQCGMSGIGSQSCRKSLCSVQHLRFSFSTHAHSKFGTNNTWNFEQYSKHF